MPFHCNICGAPNESQPEGFERDSASCGKCGSTVRMRSLLHLLSLEIFGLPLALPDFPTLKSVRGLGISDQPECASLLASSFDYRNTFYHQAPRFDITHPADEPGTYDFILAGDIFEHVAPPVEQSFANVCALLKPNGFLAMSVPYSLEETTREHFADLHEFGLVTAAGHLALVNRTRAGEWQVFDNLVFHGGPGSVLELRVFCESDLRSKLSSAGFVRLEFATAPYPPFGIVPRESWSLPLIAAKEPFHLSRDGMVEMTRHYGHLKYLESELHRLQGEFEERTRWALELDAEVQHLRSELGRTKPLLAAWEQSRWVNLGRALGLGPKSG